MSRFLNLIAALLLFAIALPAQTQQTAGNGVPAQNFAGGSGVNATSNVVAAFNVKNYGAVGGAQASRNCVFTNGSAVVTDVDNPWTAAVVGKKFQGVGNGYSAFGTTGGGTANNEVKVIGYTNAGSITVSATANGAAQGTGACVWYTQRDDTYMLAAQVAAATSTSHGQPGYASPTLSYTATVYIPPDGFVVCGTFFDDQPAIQTSQGVSLVGQYPVIYVPPCFVPPAAHGNKGTLLNSYLTYNFDVGGFMVNGLNFQNTNLANEALVSFSSSLYRAHDITINDWGSSGGIAAIAAQSGEAVRWDHIYVQNSPGLGGETGCELANISYGTFTDITCSNHRNNLLIINSGTRASSGSQGVNFYSLVVDECGTGPSCAILQNSLINVVGGVLWNSGIGTTSVNMDTTSTLYGMDLNVEAYGVDAGNSCGFTLAGNAQLFLTDSNVSGNNAGSAICGPSTSTFVSVGGNKLFNQVAGVQTLCTAATQTTAACGWSGGIQPTSTETHNMSPCYAVPGNLLATAQNVCVFRLDKNYQLVNISAQSGGTTPTNSSCAAAPVITMSDGTRSGTLTMTTGKTQWFSDVDSATVNTIFAAGTTLTVSIGANTCATPPANVSVGATLQSVLNF